MKYTSEILPKSEIKLTIDLDAAEMDKYRNEAIQKLGQEINLPGFRKGHIPRDIVESKLGSDLILSTIAEIAIPPTYAEVILKNNIPVVSKPQIKVINEDPLKYEAILAVLPKVKFIKDPKTIEVKENKIEVTAKEEKDLIDSLLKKFAKYEEKSDGAAKGDRLEIDLEGFDEKGVSLPGIKSKNHPLVIGENTFVKGFEDELVGLKKDDKKEFKITFPADYFKKDFQNKLVNFKVQAIKVEKVITPELNEEFVEKITGKKKNIVEFKEEVKTSIMNQKKEEEKSRRENEFLNELLKTAEVELPESLINDEIDFLIEDLTISLKKQGIPENECKHYVEEKKSDLLKKFRPNAEKNIKLRRALNELMAKEKISISDTDFQAKIEEIKKSYPEKEHAKIEEAYAEGKETRKHLENQLKLESLFKLFLK